MNASDAGSVVEDELSADTLDTLPTNVAVLAEDGRIVFTNRAWREFGGQDQTRAPYILDDLVSFVVLWGGVNLGAGNWLTVGVAAGIAGVVAVASGLAGRDGVRSALGSTSR